MSLKRSRKKRSVVEKGLTLDGNVTFQGQLVVNGTVKGQLSCDDLVIAQGGRVMAETRASTITIGGVFQGNLNLTGQLLLLSTGKCSGTIKCRDMALEPGGALNGNIVCGI